MISEGQACQALPCLQYGTDLDVDPSKGQDRRRQKPVAQLEFELAEHEEAIAVKEFRAALDFNMGKVGATFALCYCYDHLLHIAFPVLRSLSLRSTRKPLP